MRDVASHAVASCSAKGRSPSPLIWWLMSVPLHSADLSQPEAGGALDGWEQREAVTPRIHVPHTSTTATTEAAASESTPPVESLSDAELLTAFVQRRGADAFTEIVQRYRHLVYRVALRAVEDRHLADDVFQATFLVLAQSAHKIKSGEVLAAWLHSTARNIARRAMGNQYAEQKQLKEWAKQTLAQKGEEMATSTEADPFEELARRNEQQLLDEELQQLPEASRAPLVLFYLEKKTQAEIAQIMGLSVEAVEGRLKRAKLELRTRLIRRGVLLSTVVAAATVLTPSITFAAPAASLVSATVTTALGTAALGSTALGATAVTGAATSSKLAAGSASASTLAAQEIALMSATSKATAMLITTAASTTLISGLVLGGMVGMFSMGARGSAPTASQSINAQADLQGVINESSEPGLISSADEDQVQFALADPEKKKSSEQAPKPEVAEDAMGLVTIAVYPIADLSEEELVKVGEYAVSLADIMVHESTQSLVIRATQENHKQIAKQIEALRSQRSPWMSDQFKLVLARGRLAKSLKEFDENHPDVKQGRREVALIEKAIAEGTNQSRIVEEHEELLDSPPVTTAPEVKENNSEQSTAQAEKVDEHPNELKPFVYYVGDLTADDLQGAEDFAQSLGFSVLERRSKYFVVVHATTENDRKLADHFREIRRNRDAKSSLQFELLSARAKLAKVLKEFDENHPDVKQARNEIAAIEKELAQPTQKPRSAEIDTDIVQVVDKTTLQANQDGTANITVTDVNGKTATTPVEVPRQYIRSVSRLRNLTPVEKTIYDVLSRQEQLEFPQQTLDQFAESLSARYQIPVKVDWPALETAGVAKDATVSFSGLKRVEHALTDILSNVGGQRLEFCVDNGELLFTTQEAMRTTNRVREYDLSSLGEGHLNYDLPFPGDGELDFALQYADSLSQEITRQGKVLSFNAPLSNHKKFERFLAMLPELLKEPSSTNVPLAVHKKFEQFHAMEAVTDNAGVVPNTNSGSVSAGSEEKKAEPGQPAVDAVVDQKTNEQQAVTHPLEGIDAEKLQDVITFAELLLGTVSLDAATHSLVILDTPENQDRVSGYLTQLRERRETELKDKVEIFAARKRLAAKVKELGKDHPEVRQAQAEVSRLARAVDDRSEEAYTGEKIAISTRIFEADEQALEQLADKDAEARLILRKDAEKKLYSLSAKNKVVVISDHRWLCRIGQPNTILSGGEKPLGPVPEDWIWVGQELESVEFGTKVQLTIFDKKANNGQRVVKYDVQLTHGYSDGNNPKLNGQELPVVTGRVFRGYVPLPEKESLGALIGPVGTVERTSEEGGTRKLSTYLWIRSEEARLVP